MSQKDQSQRHPSLSMLSVLKSSVKMQWRSGRRAPRMMCNLHNGAVVCGNVVYFNPGGSKNIYAYDHTLPIRRSWSQHSDCLYIGCSLAVVNNLLTTIGGGDPGFSPTNKLFCFTRLSTSSDVTWLETLPPMPTERWNTVSLCTGAFLIVAGGLGKWGSLLTTVEVLNTETCQWFSVNDLPHPVNSVSGAVCGDHIYVAESFHRSVYTCLVSDLLGSESYGSSRSHPAGALPLPTEVSVWKRVADVPLLNTTCVSLHDKLIVVGGVDPRLDIARKDIHMYDSTTDSWTVISQMSTARSACFAIVLSDKRLMVVGGIVSYFFEKRRITDSVEFATSKLLFTS